MVPVPKQVKHPFFYKDDNEKVLVYGEEIDPLHPFFSYEILYFSNQSMASLPWEDVLRLNN